MQETLCSRSLLPHWRSLLVQFNLVTLIAFIVGAMGFPALIIFPYFLWKHHRAQKALQNGALETPGLLPSWQAQVRGCSLHVHACSFCNFALSLPCMHVMGVVQALSSCPLQR